VKLKDFIRTIIPSDNGAAMEIRQLKAFVTIAEAGTFTAGAQRVHVTQAAISMQIRQLEEELGVKLFVRAPRRVLLTEAGEKLLDRARLILREHDTALMEMAELAGAKHGRLRIGTSSAMVSANPLPQLLKKLKELYPQADITVASGTSEKLAQQILSGELDIAFVSLPVEANGIQTELLAEDELVAIASPEHPLAKRRVVSAAMLAGEKLILGQSGGNTRRLIEEFFSQAGVKPNVVMELSRQTAINRMVEQGLGVGIAPIKSVKEDVSSGKLVSWWIEGALINWELGLARLRGGYESPILRTFIKLCRETYGKTAPKLETKYKQPIKAATSKLPKKGQLKALAQKKG
jgi:DNA-binding transcriptional LysR family regulator